MKLPKNLYIFVLLFLFTTITFAQNNIEKFSPNGEEFTAELPSKPRFFAYPLSERDDKKFYQLVHNDKYFFINCDKKLEYSYYESIVDFLNKNTISILSNINSREDGEYLKVIDSEGFYQTILTVNRPDRFYIFHTISEVENDPIIDNFFASIKFKPYSDSAESMMRGNAKKQNKLKDVKENKNFEDPGKVNVPKSMLKNNTAAKDAKGPTVGIKILSKARPEYTLLARNYSLGGHVRLKVTFLRNGQIGGVSAVKRLPLGLTIKSIEAAKQLAFQPPMYNGVPFSVNKVVQYHFEVY